MERESIGIVSEQEWLTARSRDLTSTEVAALYDLNPYATIFEIWHRKKAGEVQGKTDTERMKWGRRLESAIAEGVAEDMGWPCAPRKIYQRLPDLRLGASFDFEATKDNELGLMEVKNVDRRIFDDHWHGEGDDIQAPPHIELQLQVQLLVSGLSWGCIVVLAGGNKASVLMRQPDQVIHADIVNRVRAFWASIDAGQEPKPNWEKDAEFIRKQLRLNVSDEVIVASDETTKDLLDLAEAQSRLALIEAQVDALKAKVLYTAGSACKITSSVGTVSCGYVAATPGKIITPDMVGQTIGGRAGYRTFRFTSKKK